MNPTHPDLVPPAPAYEGRSLPRPEEEVVDQGLPFDLVTLLSRRRAITLIGLGVGGAALAACGVTGSSVRDQAAGTAQTEIPDETAGPYPGDGSNGPDILAQSGIVRSDIRTSIGTGTGTAVGVPLDIEFVVADLANGATPFAGVAVYAWHCDRDGGYSMYSAGLEQETYLRGVQIADDQGRVRFTSVFPGCYPGRWPHVHFEVYPDQASLADSTNAISTSQLAFPRDVCEAVYATEGYEQSVANLARLTLETDSVFGDDAAAHQLATVTGGVAAGYLARLAVPVDTGTAPQAAGPGGGQGPR